MKPQAYVFVHISTWAFNEIEKWQVFFQDTREVLKMVVVGCDKVILSLGV